MTLAKVWTAPKNPIKNDLLDEIIALENRMRQEFFYGEESEAEAAEREEG